VAIQEVTKTVRTALFGFGLGAGDFMIFDRTLSYSGKSVEIWSWDNEYALRLLETGAIGLFCTIIMYVMIIKKLFVERNNIRQDYSYIVSGIIASVSIMLFMMTNVHIFAVQLHYLFWSLVAIGLKINRDEISYKNAPIIV
jgi:O-antigen ligase